MNEDVLRRQLVAQLDGGQAYTPIEEAIRGFPVGLAGRRPEGVRHTPWEILLVADHNACHLGQLVLIRRALESAASRSVRFSAQTAPLGR